MSETATGREVTGLGSPSCPVSSASSNWLPRQRRDRGQVPDLGSGRRRAAGIFSAAILAALEEDLQISIVDHFDLIAGTSTGGIIALGLGLGLRPRQMVEFYAELGKQVFRSRLGLGPARRLLRAKYQPGPLREALTGVFGDRTFGESTKRLVITSYNLGADDVYLFRNRAPSAASPGLARARGGRGDGDLGRPDLPARFPAVGNAAGGRRAVGE